MAVFQVEVSLGGPGGQKAGCKPTVSAYSLENQLYPGLHQNRVTAGQKEDCPPFALPCEALSRVLHPGLGPP